MNPLGKGVWNPIENREPKTLNFIDYINVKKKNLQARGLFKCSLKLEIRKYILK